MKKRSVFLKTLPVLLVVACMCNACRKESNPPRPAHIHWLLNSVFLSFFDDPVLGGGGQSYQQWHRFAYNEYKKPWLHMEADIYFNYTRLDTFFYDNRQRLIEISSNFSPLSAKNKVMQRKVFRYDALSRRISALKYILDTTSYQYRIADSTAYLYQDTTIFKIIHHIWSTDAYKPNPVPGTIDTAFFVYNRQGNLVKAKVKYGSYNVLSVFTQFDNAPNPFQSLGVEALELEPLDDAEWYKPFFDKFRLMMEMPRFSKNNYLDAAVITYGSADSMVATILPDADFHNTQSFDYIPGN
jgi:hypothetical protein